MARADFGGQALLEGVLMRGRNAVGVAIRHPDGSIVSAAEPLNSILHRNRFARAPFMRGIVLLYEQRPSPWVLAGQLRDDAAACRFELSSTDQIFTASGGSASVNVSTLAGCAWTAEADAPWVGVTSGAAGTGAGTGCAAD